MIKLSILLIAAAVVTVCSGRYLPKKEFVKQTKTEWETTAKKIGWNDEQTTAVIHLMQFIQEQDLGSAEMNDEKEKLMLENCGKLADKIDERNEYVGDKKWADVKDKDLKEKLQYWNDKYETWSCEEGKMRALKNMCSLISENDKKKAYLERATRAGLKDEQLTAMVNLLWDMKISPKKVGTLKAKMADSCEILGSDGKMLDISEKHMANLKWSDMADKNISMKMEFWWNVTKESDCNVAKVKAIKNLCVEFMCPVERKIIEDVAKEAGLAEEDIPAAVDMEMRMKLAQGTREQSDMMMESFKKLGKNKQIMEIPLTDAEKEKWSKLETVLDWIPKVHFWAKKYNESTGVDHIKALKNMCSVIVRDWEKQEEHDKKLKEKQTAPTN